MSILDQIDRATEIEARTPFLPKGKHKVAVLRIYEFKSAKNGASVGAEVLLLESDNPQAKIGTPYVNFFLVSKQPSWPGDQRQLDNLVSFCGQLAGVADHAAAKQATKDILARQREQPARGALIEIECFTQMATVRGTKEPKIGADGKQIGYHKQRFTAVDQTPDDLIKMRAWLDENHPLTEQTVTTPPPAPAPIATVTPALPTSLLNTLRR